QLSQEQLQKKNQELVEIYREKSKKHAQITNLYNLLKSRAMRSQIQTAASDSASQTIESLEASKAPDAGLHPPLSSLIASPTSRQYGPYPVPNDSNEQLYRNQRGRVGIGSSNNHLDNIAMAPPSRPPG